MQITRRKVQGFLAAGLLAVVLAAQDNSKKPTSYMPVAIPEDFATDHEPHVRRASPES